MTDSPLPTSHRLTVDTAHSVRRGESHAIQDLIHTRIVRINAAAFAAVIAVMAAVGLFAVTNYLVLKGGPVVGPHLALLGQILLGYRVTVMGSFIGAAWAGAIGWVVGWSGARIYNAIAAMRDE